MLLFAIEIIWNDKGGDAYDFLEQILVDKPKNLGIASMNDSYLMENLNKYGPALVAGFKVSTDFTNMNTWQHVGSWNENSIGRHAMLLICHRKTEYGMRYLLQNWWDQKPWIEVDLEYLNSSKALIYFIKESQTDMGDFINSFEQHVECESGLDASENFIPETFKSKPMC